MTTIASSIETDLLSGAYALIDTHSHFDAPVFDSDRMQQAQLARARGVRHVVLVGYLYQHFERLYRTQHALLSAISSKDSEDSKDSKNSERLPHTHIALGLHPFYIEQHTDMHLQHMAQRIEMRRPIAIGEIGLDTYTDTMKQPTVFAKQQRFFIAQLDMAVRYQLPVMLHIRKAHAAALTILKAHDYDAHKLGGIAHSFSGGVQEAKAFVKLGFKLGVTGQITNPNAKKLRLSIQAAVESYGIGCLVIETDCPDMMPIRCQIAANSQTSHPQTSVSTAAGQSLDKEWRGIACHNRNVPANLPWILLSLSELLNLAPTELARQLWQNSGNALQKSWQYPN